MEDQWHKLHISDKTGQAFFKTTASPLSTVSELRNLKRHVEQAKSNPKTYAFLDVDTAVIMLDGVPYEEPIAPSEQELDELFAELQAG